MGPQAQATRVQVLNGFWKNTDGLICNVSDGQCTFGGPAVAHPVMLQDGKITLNGWVVSDVRENTVSWTKASKEMEWMKMDPLEAREALKMVETQAPKKRNVS